MYGLPEDFDLSPLIGQVVQSVSFSANTVYVHFDGGDSIRVEGAFSHGDASGMSWSSVPVDTSALMRLAGRTVAAASVDGPGDLRLTFDDGQVLVCHDDSVAYESYAITIGDTETVV